MDFQWYWLFLHKLSKVLSSHQFRLLIGSGNYPKMHVFI